MFKTYARRLYSPKHGIYSPLAVPLVSGAVYVYALTPDGRFIEALKHFDQVRIV